MGAERASLWRRLGPAERAFALLIAAAAIGGLFLIADGLYLKARAEHFAAFDWCPAPVRTDDATHIG